MAESDLKFDTDKMLEASNAYLSDASDMKTLRDNLKKALDDLKSGWDTEAGAAFFAKFEEDWYENVGDYAAVIEYMGNNLAQCKTEYDSVYTMADKIRLKDAGEC